jgi:flagellar assembly protein FliH
MLSRARLVSNATVDVVPFDWNAGVKPAPAATPHGAPSLGARVDRPATALDHASGASAHAGAAPASQVSVEAIRLEHQAHLAALEREAFAKGYAQGERAGLEAGGKRAEAMLRRVAQTLDDLGSLRETLMQQTERQMVQLALTIARRIVSREVTLDPELISAMAHVALKKLGTASPATIRLNPEDYTIVTRDGGDRWGGGGAQVTVVPDPQVARGGCLVESDFGRIDASLDHQFEEMSRALLGESRGSTGHIVP